MNKKYANKYQSTSQSNMVPKLFNKLYHHVTLVWHVLSAQVNSSSTDFSFQNLVFWNLFEFLMAEISFKSISPTFQMQILPNKFH